MKLNDEEIVQIANYSLSLFEEKSAKPSAEISQIQINEIPITEIMEAFFIIWRAPETKFGTERINSRKPIIKRRLRQSLCKLYQSGILGKVGSIPADGRNMQGEYTDMQYNDLLKSVQNIYGVERYSFSEEAFWLIMGYAPPHNYIPRENQQDLYACCFYDLHRIWRQYYQLLKYQSPRYVPLDFVELAGTLEQNECAVYGTQLGIGVQLHKALLKARAHLADKWGNEMERSFLRQLPSKRVVDAWNKKEIYQYLLSNIAADIYQEIATVKTSFKDQRYASDVFNANLLDECFTLAGRLLYQKVFETLALLSCNLWKKL